MFRHEGYHPGQVKLALKLASLPIPDEEAGPLTVASYHIVGADRA